MTISMTINRSLYPISYGDVVYPIDYGRDECWKDSLLVHYDHGFTRIPRVGFIQEIRPLPFSFSQGLNRNMSNGLSSKRLTIRSMEA